MAAVSLCLPAVLHAHGMALEIVASAGSVTVQCSYSNGDPAAAEVLVHSPADATRFYAVIQTDELGRVSFQPDSPGAWRVVADDGIGHRAKLAFRIDEDGVAHPVDDRAARLRRYWLLAGACAGVLAWWVFVRRRHRA